MKSTFSTTSTHIQSRKDSQRKQLWSISDCRDLSIKRRFCMNSFHFPVKWNCSLMVLEGCCCFYEASLKPMNSSPSPATDGFPGFTGHGWSWTEMLPCSEKKYAVWIHSSILCDLVALAAQSIKSSIVSAEFPFNATWWDWNICDFVLRHDRSGSKKHTLRHPIMSHFEGKPSFLCALPYLYVW